MVSETAPSMRSEASAPPLTTHVISSSLFALRTTVLPNSPESSCSGHAIWLNDGTAAFVTSMRSPMRS
jgi:hypothetical protein